MLVRHLMNALLSLALLLVCAREVDSTPSGPRAARSALTAHNYGLRFVATFADSAAAHRTKGDFCAGSSKALANKIRSVDRFTLLSLGEWDWRPTLRAVTAPALVIRGAMDHVPLESAREWAAALPNGRLLSLERSGHFPYLDTPDTFFAAVEIFLRGGWPAGAERVSDTGLR